MSRRIEQIVHHVAETALIVSTRSRRSRLRPARSARPTVEGVNSTAGPGSFTGLRIGIAFLKGFFFGRDARVFPVSSLESMAGSWNARRARIVCASDARNGEVFWARFERTDDTISRLSPDALAPEDEFRNALDAGDVVITDTLGYGKSRAFAFLKERPNAFSVERCPLQRGLSCAMIAAKRIGDAAGWTTADRVLPRYLHAVSAEKKRTGQAG